MPFPKINYEYWSTQNPFYQEIPLFETIRTCIENYASRPGLINDINTNIITCSGLVSIIQSEINNVIKNNLYQNVDLLLRIFDLIQSWGGKTGRGPYVPFSNPSRNNYQEWIQFYQEGIIKAINGDRNGLNHFILIPKIGESFGSKHLNFWSRFGGGNEHTLPIYDERIKILLYHNLNLKPRYDFYLNDMRDYSQQINLPIADIEMALFGFSSNYFPNSTLEIKKNIEDNTDRTEAERLSAL